MWIRINPGFGHGHSRKTNTGGEHSKHGIWHEHLEESLALVDRHGLDLVGLHMHIGSGVDYGHLESVCETMVKQVRMAGRDIRAISAGGGLSVPYTPGDPEIDTDRYFELWDAARRELVSELGHPVRLEIEPGRFLVAGAGVLAAEVRAQKPVGSNYFVLVDAGFNDLMRPAMYGSNHRVSVLDADGAPAPRTPATPSWPGRCASRGTSSPRSRAGTWNRCQCPAPTSATWSSSTTPAPTARACRPPTTPGRSSPRSWSTAPRPA